MRLDKLGDKVLVEMTIIREKKTSYVVAYVDEEAEFNNLLITVPKEKTHEI